MVKSRYGETNIKKNIRKILQNTEQKHKKYDKYKKEMINIGILTLFVLAYFDVSGTGGGAHCAPPKYLWVGEG